MPVTSNPCGPKRGACAVVGCRFSVVAGAVVVVVVDVEQPTAINTIARGRMRRILNPPMSKVWGPKIEKLRERRVTTVNGTLAASMSELRRDIGLWRGI